jgi:ethanolamine ammonia-lyase small subunit
LSRLKALQEFTSARIAIGRVGTSIPLKQSLDFKLAHAHARDAVYSTLALDHLTEALKPFNLPVLHLHSRVTDRRQYLQRPDLGRKLNDAFLDQRAIPPKPT